MQPVSLLLVDDDPCLHQPFSDMLAFHFPSVSVTAVDSGAAALEQVKKQEYDLVICDLMMPGMDGAMTVAAIRKDHPSLRMYLMTGHPAPETAYKTTLATGFIKKPLDREWFLDFMHRTVKVVSVGKRAVAIVMQTNECLSSSMKRHADVEVLLQIMKASSSR